MYVIEIHMDTREGPLRLRYATKPEVMAEWDRTVENTVKGQRVVLRDPQGRIMSSYEPLGG